MEMDRHKAIMWVLERARAVQRMYPKKKKERE